MNSRRTLAATLLLAAAGIALAAHLRPVLLGWFGQEGPVGHSEPTSSPEPIETGEALTASREKLRLRNAVVAHLIQGDMTVLEAGAWFLFLNEMHPRVPDGVQQRWAGDSKEEKVCRQAVDWAVIELRASGMEGRVQQLEARLERELGEQLAKNGRVVLPDLGDALLPAPGAD